MDFAPATLHLASLAALLAPLSLATLLLSPAAAAVPGAPVTPASRPRTLQDGETLESGRRSLEDLLREVRAEQGRTASNLKPEVSRIVGEIDGLRASRRGPLSRELTSELIALGPSALALLVPYLEPGETITRQTVFRCELIAKVLQKRPSATTTDALVRVAQEGSFQARLGALRALEATREPRRVAPAIIELAAGEHTAGFKREEIETLSRASFSTLAALDDDRARAFIEDALKGSNQLLCAGALSALAGAPATSSAAQILSLLGTLEDPQPVAGSIADYYEQHEELLLDPDHARALGGIAVHESTPNEPRVRMFDTLRVTDAKIGTVIKRRVAPFLDASRPDVRGAAQKLLARLKDRGARQDLLREFDERIKRDKRSTTAYSDRATIYHAIGDWSASVRDWRIVMTQMAEDELTRARKAPYIGIARSLARLKKYREAASYLTQGPLSVAELQTLGGYRDFAEMRASRHGAVFQLGD